MIRLLILLVLGTQVCLAQARVDVFPVPSQPDGGAAHWELVWNDEFTKPEAELDAAWQSQNGPSGHILSSRWRENVVVTNGLLRLVNRKEQRGGQEWTSGSIWTRQMFQYGYFECRYRYAAAEGVNNSFWLMPTGTNKITRGKFFEIDINEGHYPNEVNNNIHNHTDQTMVNGRKTHPTASRSFVFGSRPDVVNLGEDGTNWVELARFDVTEGNFNFSRDFQVHGLEWNERELVFYFNGKEIRRVKNEFCLSPAAVWLSAAIIPWAGRVADAIDGTAMEVDYVRIYRKRP